MPFWLLRLTKLEWVVVVAIGIVVFALIVPYPWPHWMTTGAQSCHICGNHRYVTRQFRWWCLAFEAEKVTAEHPIAEGHVHDWWEYDWNYISWMRREGGSRDHFRPDVRPPH